MAGFADRYPLHVYAEAAGISWYRSGDFDRDRGDESKAAAIAEANRLDALGRAALDAHQEASFRPAVAAFLADLREAGRIGPMGGLKGRRLWQAAAWNAFAGGGDVDAERWFVPLFDGVLTWALVRVGGGRRARDADGATTREPGVHVVPTQAMVEASWRGLCAVMDAGDSHEFIGELRNVECQDARSGDRCEIAFSGWKATLMRRNGAHGLEPAPDLGPIPLSVVEFDLPSGDLLLTDHLRVDGDRKSGFGKATDFGDREYGAGLDLGSALGRANRTAAHAAEHGLGYVQTTNTSVVVHRHPVSGALLVSERFGRDGVDEDADGHALCQGWDKVGTFSCDVWRATIVDRETAVSLMERGGTPEAAAALEAYLASGETYAGNVVRTKVAPGRWRLHAGEDFSRRVNRKRHAIPKGIRPWLLLEPVADTPRPTPPFLA